MAGAAGLGPPKGPRDGVLSAPASARCTQPTPRTPAGQGALEPGGAWWFDERKPRVALRTEAAVGAP